MTIPGKVQSYLACGKPIIASLDGIGSEIIKDASCGFSQMLNLQWSCSNNF